MKKIKTIINKEWAQVFKNRMVLFTVIFMPLFFAILPLALLGFAGQGGSTGQELTSEMPAQFSTMCPPGISGVACFQVFLTQQFMLAFMLVPLIIPVNIAAYSIVGEKTTRSLEPLLATPITTLELLVGKNLAAAIPAVLGSWLSYLLFIIGVILITKSAEVTNSLITPVWLIAILIVGPLLAILSVNFSLMVSSRVTDPRVAEQVSAVVIVPVLIVFFAQIAGLFFLNQTMVLLMALVVLVLDILLMFMAERVFQRETILTKWK